MNKPVVLDCLLVHTPKLHNFYKLIGRHMYCMLMPMGIFAIGDMVTRNGYKTQVLRLGVEKIKNPSFSLINYLKNTQPKIIGLSLHWYLRSYRDISSLRLYWISGLSKRSNLALCHPRNKVFPKRLSSKLCLLWRRNGGSEVN
jgi:hypothetical protein